MNTKFLSIEPVNKSSRVSIPFLVASVVWFLVVFAIVDSLFKIAVTLPLGLLFLWLFLANDMVTSLRFLRYQLMTHDIQRASFEDTMYIGDAFFEVGELKDVVFHETESDPSDLNEIIID